MEASRALRAEEPEPPAALERQRNLSLVREQPAPAQIRSLGAVAIGAEIQEDEPENERASDDRRRFIEGRNRQLGIVAMQLRRLGSRRVIGGRLA